MVIAITKDLPDVEGDRQFGISTLATRLGERKVAFLGARLFPATVLGGDCSGEGRRCRESAALVRHAALRTQAARTHTVKPTSTIICLPHV